MDVRMVTTEVMTIVTTAIVTDVTMMTIAMRREVASEITVEAKFNGIQHLSRQNSGSTIECAALPEFTLNFSETMQQVPGMPWHSGLNGNKVRSFSAKPWLPPQR